MQWQCNHLCSKIQCLAIPPYQQRENLKGATRRLLAKMRQDQQERANWGLRNTTLPCLGINYNSISNTRHSIQRIPFKYDQKQNKNKKNQNMVFQKRKIIKSINSKNIDLSYYLPDIQYYTLKQSLDRLFFLHQRARNTRGLANFLFFVLEYNIMKENQIEYQQFLINGWENKEESLQYGQNSEHDRRISKNKCKQNVQPDNKVLPFKECKEKRIQKRICNNSMPKILAKKQSQNCPGNLKIVKSTIKLTYPVEGNHLQPIPYQTSNQNCFTVKIFHKQHKSFNQQQPENRTFFRTRTDGLERYNLFSRRHSKAKNDDQPVKIGERGDSLLKKMQKCCLVENKDFLIFKQKKLKMHSTTSEFKSKIDWRRPNYLPFAYREAIQKYYKQARPKLKNHLHINNQSKHPVQQQFQRYSTLQSRS